MKKKISYILLAILFLAGLSLLLYPFVSNKWNTYRQSKLITKYDQAIAEQNEAAVIDYETEWEKAEAYNEALLPYILPDSFALAALAEEPDEAYMSCLNLNGDGMMGYVEIPKIDVKIPIYHTTNQEVLEKAAGHLEGSTLPVGGTDTHAVISAHRGLPSAALFTDLDKLAEGDHFLLYVLDDVLCYEVDQILVVEPSDTEALGVVEGKDLVTLLTCTPYGVNSHRLLVRGHRVEYVEEEVLEVERSTTDFSLHTNYLLWVIVGLIVTGLFILILFLCERKLHRKVIKDKIRKEILGETKHEPEIVTPETKDRAKE